jgi:uncharacterized membrane protein YhaH (DUF805 family)
MFSLSRPIGRIRFVLGVGVANSLIILATLISFAFLPSGAGHIAVLVVMAALLWWWFSLHARRFLDAGRGLFWPAAMGLLCFGVFALSYGVIAALWSVPEVQQEAFRTGGSDYTKHVETSAALLGLGRWFAGWVGAAGAVMLAGFLAMLMGFVALLSGFVTLAGLLMSSGAPRILPPPNAFRTIPRSVR